MPLGLRILIACCALFSVQLTFAQSISSSAPHPALERAHRKARIEGLYPTQFNFQIMYRDNDFEAHVFVNPSNPPGERLDVLKPARSDWNDEFKEMLREFDAKPFEGFWCTDFLELVGPDAHPVTREDNYITFAFTPQPGPDGDSDDQKFLSGMIAHLTVDQTNGAIRRFEMRSRRPFKPIFIAKIKSFQMETQCEVAPDGRTYVSKSTTDMSAKIALKKIEEHEQRMIFGLTSPR